MENGSSAVLFFRNLYCGGLIQIPLELLPLDQRPISVHNIEIFVRVLVDQHPQFPLADVIVAGCFFNGQRVSAPHRNVKTVLLAHIALAIRHRHLPPYINSLCRDGSFRPLLFSVLRSFQYLPKPGKGETETETGNRLLKTRFFLAAVVFAILVFLEFLCCLCFQRRKSLAEQSFSRKPIWQRTGYETGNHATFLKRQLHLAAFFLSQFTEAVQGACPGFHRFVSTHPAPLLAVLLITSGIGIRNPVTD